MIAWQILDLFEDSLAVDFDDWFSSRNRWNAGHPWSMMMMVMMVRRMRGMVVMVMVMRRWYNRRDILALNAVHLAERSRGRAGLLGCYHHDRFLFWAVVMKVMMVMARVVMLRAL